MIFYCQRQQQSHPSKSEHQNSPSLPIQHLLSRHPRPPRPADAVGSSRIGLISFLASGLLSLLFRPPLDRRRRRSRRALLLTARTLLLIAGHAHTCASSVRTPPDAVFDQVGGPLLDGGGLVLVGPADAAEEDVDGVEFLPFFHTGARVSYRPCCCLLKVGVLTWRWLGLLA